MEITPDILAYIALRVESSLAIDQAARLERQAVLIRQALRELPVPKEEMKEIERVVKEATKKYSDEWWKNFRAEKTKELAENAEKVKSLKTELESIQGRFEIKK